MTESGFVQEGVGTSWGRKFLWGCLLAYIAILSVSDTIALRNLLLLVSVIGAVVCITFDFSEDSARIKAQLSSVPLVFILWAIFLLLFPLWAAEPEVAWKNLRGQWAETLLSWGVGFGAVIALGRHGPSLWSLALASGFPVLLHLTLTLIAWAGLASAEFLAEPSLHTLWLTIRDWLTNGFVLNWQPFPIAYRGVEPMHGNIGYSACQTIVLAAACSFRAWPQQDRFLLRSSGLLILFCFLSIFIAASRGGVVFGFLMLGLAFVLYRLKFHVPEVTSKSDFSWCSVRGLMSVTVFFLFAVFAGWSLHSDTRWHSMFDKVELGLSVPEPERVLCEGLSTAQENAIRQRFAGRDPAYVEELIGGLKIQDGGRLLLMREGWQLVGAHPLGLDGSRQSYEKLIQATCGHRPVLNFSHAHQAWINLTLALGWTGGLLYALVLASCAWQGWVRSQDSEEGPWAFALVLMALFWFMRGFFDAVYQDHYLQMQGFMLATLLMRSARA